MEDIKPEVGMGVTYGCWTDRYAGTIIKVSASGREITVQDDHARRTDNNGMSECQSYEYTPNPEGAIMVFTLRKNGRWTEKGSPMGKGYRAGIGHRNAYHDYSF